MIFIDDLVGKPYKKNGRGPNGYDCYGLAIEVEKRFGHEWKKIEDCEKDGYDFNECLTQWKTLVDIKEVSSLQKESDIVLLKDNKGVISHIGVYLGNGMIIHCNYLGVHIDRVLRLKGIIGKIYSWEK